MEAGSEPSHAAEGTHLVGEQLAGGDQIVHDQGPGALLQAVCKLNAAHVKHHRPPRRLHTRMAVREGGREEKGFTATNNERAGSVTKQQANRTEQIQQVGLRCDAVGLSPFSMLVNAAEDVIVQSLDP